MELFHNICAVDLGSWASKIAALTNSHKFEILVNEANFRETPSVVGFTNAERLIGDQAVIKMKSNFKNTIRAPQRLIGLAKKPHILQQQMKYSILTHRVINNSILIQIDSNSQKYEVEPEQILAALFTKFHLIFEDNNIKSDSVFISVQSYLNNGQRKVIKTCAESAGFKNIGLIEEWEAIAAEYFFVRQQQIVALSDERLVIFVDLGYANFAVHACIISKNQISLLDQQYLRYTGAKNIDNLLFEFYLQLILKQTGTNIRNNPKAVIKLQQAVEIQRKKLSANTQNQMVIECLFGDYDLSYNMKRQQLQDIAMPILAELASTMQNLRSRVEPLSPIHSVEVIGGMSRMPFLQQVIKSVFNMQPSKKMNASQSIARGCSIAAASRLGMLKNNMCSFLRTVRSPIVIFQHVVSTDNKNYGKSIANYQKCERKIIFDKNSLIPANTIVKIDGEGLNQVLICKEDSLGMIIIGYVVFKGPDNLTILIDNDAIMRARLMKQNNFVEYDFGDLLTVDQTVKLRDWQLKMKTRDNNILQSYEIRNEFQSLLYSTKQNLNTVWKEFCPPQESKTILEIVQEGQNWLQKSNEHSIQNFKQRIDTISMFMQIITSRKARKQKIEQHRKTFAESCNTVSKLKPNVQPKLNEIQQVLIDRYNKESNQYWEGNILNEEIMKQAIQQVNKLK